MMILRDDEWKLDGTSGEYYQFKDAVSDRKDCNLLLTKEAKYVLREWDIVLVFNILEEDGKITWEVKCTESTAKRFGLNPSREAEVEGHILEMIKRVSSERVNDFSNKVARLFNLPGAESQPRPIGIVRCGKSQRGKYQKGSIGMKTASLPI